MRVVASEEAQRYVAEHGGRLFVRPRSAACCRSVAWLDTATEPNARTVFRRVAENGIEVWAPAGLKRLPDMLEVELRRFPRRHVEAYWDGCAWIV